MKSKLPTTYGKILSQLKGCIRDSRQKATIAVNAELLQLYWQIGNIILTRQQKEGWGTKVISRLAIDLKKEFKDMKGLSERNLNYMLAFAAAYPEFTDLAGPNLVKRSILQAPLAKSGKIKKVKAISNLLVQLSWYHHITLLEKIKNSEERLFYMYKAIENGWSRNVMVHQIERGLHKRQGKAITNFTTTLPGPQSDLAKEAIKNPYVLDFLGLNEKVQERELEQAIITNLKKFVLELGKGFAYVGNQHNFIVEGDEYFLDLLFFNYHLNCFVIFELKIGEFKPEYAGKLNFYINTVDEKLKSDNHQPTIGILLCKTPNKTVIEYSLRGMLKPLGVSDYQFSKSLPSKLKNELPTVEELEEELERETKGLKRSARRLKVRNTQKKTSKK